MSGYWKKGTYIFQDSDGNDLTLGRLWQDWTGQTNINKSLQAQQDENAKMRQYNLELAKKQNEWNIAQWNRENAYNAPSAQKARLESAGLNADMMYGGSGVMNTATSSPQMISGAPASPMDWSSLANKKTTLQTAAEMANIDNIKAVTDKIRSETEGVDIDNKYKDVKNQLGIEIDKQVIKKYGKELELLEKQITKVQSETANIDADTMNKFIDGIMRSKQMEHIIRKAKAEADVAESDARVRLKSEMHRILTYQYQSDEAEAKAGLAQFQESTAWAPLAIQAAQLGINIFETALKFKNLKDFFKSRPDLFPPVPPAGN